jgi:alkylated DNA repair dioxygenase AlkB
MTTSTNSKMITITFGDVAENHVGMQQIGTKSQKGFDLADLKYIERMLKERGATSTKVYDLKELSGAINTISKDTDDAYVLVIKNGAKYLGHRDVNGLYKEQLGLDWDTKAKMRGTVKNKRARYNLCYADAAQEPDYDNNKGRIYNFKDLPLINEVRRSLSMIIPDTGSNLMPAEGNYYYDTKKCGIGYHGDSERNIVIAIRLGASLPICYRWYHRSNQVGNTISIDLDHGDIYVMSEKATGNDWKYSSKYTLRHATGSGIYTNSKPKK